MLDGLLAPKEEDRIGAQERIGMQAVQSHAWFGNLDWDELSAGNIKVGVQSPVALTPSRLSPPHPPLLPLSAAICL